MCVAAVIQTTFDTQTMLHAGLKHLKDTKQNNKRKLS